MPKRRQFTKRFACTNSGQARDIAYHLRDRRMVIWQECYDIATRAAQENRSLTDEEQGTWDGLQEAMSRVDKQIKAALETAKRLSQQSEGGAS